MDFSFKDIDLPLNVNLDELYEQLPDGVAASSARDKDGNLVSITIHAPDNKDYELIKQIVKNHVPTKTEEEAIEDKIADDFELKLSASGTIKDIIARLTILEGK